MIRLIGAHCVYNWRKGPSFNGESQREENMAFAVKNLVTKAFVMKFVELVGRAFSSQVISAKFLSGTLFAFALNKLRDSMALRKKFLNFVDFFCSEFINLVLK